VTMPERLSYVSRQEHVNVLSWTIQIYENDVMSHVNDVTHTRSQKSCGQGDSGA
jgi:hypothetical protein